MYKIRSAVLETVIGVKSSVPQHVQPEAAFAGRSNVGKSSLINTLLLRKSLARISSTPGKTQTINYYHVNEGTPAGDVFLPAPFAPDCFLVDLPGYGYTTAGVTVRSQWGKMVERYLSASGSLGVLFLLVDIRHKPTADDVQMADWIRRQGMKTVIVATKKDKLKRSQVAKALSEIRRTLGLAADDQVIAFSSETGEGADEVWQVIRELYERPAAEAAE